MVLGTRVWRLDFTKSTSPHIEQIPMSVFLEIEGASQDGPIRLISFQDHADREVNLPFDAGTELTLSFDTNPAEVSQSGVYERKPQGPTRDPPVSF